MAKGEKLPDRRIKFTFQAGDKRELPLSMGQRPVLPKHYWEGRDFEKKIRALDRKKSYLVYCRTGNRSRKATVAMEALGFRAIFHMNEGIVKWKQQNLPLTPPS